MEKLLRTTLRPEKDLIFFAMPYGVKKLRDGTEQNFQDLYDYYYAPAVRDLGLKPDRADRIYGTTQGVLQATWLGIERAAVVVVDFTTRSADVALEFGWAMCLHKRMIVLAETLDDIPTDVKGQIRPIIYSFQGAGLGKMAQELKAELRRVINEPQEEMTLKPLETAVPARAQVISAEPDCVIVRDIENPRRIGEMRKGDVEYTREIPQDMSKRYPVNHELEGTFIHEADGLRFTQRAGRRNPWPDLREAYPPGRTFTTRVVNIATTGAVFVEVEHGVNALVQGVDGHAMGLRQFNELEVIVQLVDIDRQRFTVALANRPAFSGPASTNEEQYPDRGMRLSGTVARVAPGQGGVRWLLVNLPGYPRSGILHRRAMTERLRTEVDAGAVKQGDPIQVEVTRVDPVQRRIELRDLTDVGDTAANADEAPHREADPQ